MTSTLSPPAEAVKHESSFRRRRSFSDPWHWVVSAVSLLAVLAAATSLNGVVEPWTWLLPSISTLVPVLLVMAITRALHLRGALTALAGALTLICALTAQFAPQHSVLGILPGPGSSSELRRLLTQAE